MLTRTAPSTSNYARDTIPPRASRFTAVTYIPATLLQTFGDPVQLVG